MTAGDLTPAQRRRYARHLSLPEVGEAGQRRLKASSALVVGVGGLGSPAALYLAAAGLGRIGLVDEDTVEETNLQRQILYRTQSVGQRKVESGARQLQDLNPDIAVETHAVRLDAANAEALIRDYDLVLNGADNFPTRYVLNDACVLHGKPQVHGAIHRFLGEVTLFVPGKGPCYRCLHPHPPQGAIPSCAEAGVLGVLPGIVGSLQAAEALKWLLSLGEPLIGRLLLLDALTMRFREVRLPPSENCPVCGPYATIRRVEESAARCAAQERWMQEITATELKARMDRGEPFLLIDVREPEEYERARIPGAVLVPLATLPQRADEWDPETDIVLQCRSGRRSADALAYLAGRGFSRLANLRGGILAWSDDVDPSVPKY